MSISAMADQEIARKLQRRTMAVNAAPAVRTEATKSGSAVTDALSSIVTYIPTEIVTIYVAVIAALTVKGHVSLQAAWISFWAFLVLTPAVSLLVYAAKAKTPGSKFNWDPNEWPVWPMTAATIAYAAWAFALSDTPFSMFSWYSSAVSAVVILAVSSMLALVAPLVTSD